MLSFISFLSFPFLNLIIFCKRNFVVAATMFMNSNTLQVPIALRLMQSLILLIPDLIWGEHDNKNMMLGGALTYLMMYSTLGMVVCVTLMFIISLSFKTTDNGFPQLFWYSYGIKLLSCTNTIPSQPEDKVEGSVEECAPLLCPFHLSLRLLNRHVETFSKGAS